MAWILLPFCLPWLLLNEYISILALDCENDLWQTCRTIIKWHSAASSWLDLWGRSKDFFPREGMYSFVFTAIRTHLLSEKRKESSWEWRNGKCYVEIFWCWRILFSDLKQTRKREWEKKSAQCKICTNDKKYKQKDTLPSSCFTIRKTHTAFACFQINLSK